MSSGLVTAAYIVAAILFIFSLAGLSKQETAKQGCYSGVAGMAVALFVTVFSENTHGLRVWQVIPLWCGWLSSCPGLVPGGCCGFVQG